MNENKILGNQNKIKYVNYDNEHKCFEFLHKIKTVSLH